MDVSKCSLYPLMMVKSWPKHMSGKAIYYYWNFDSEGAFRWLIFSLCVYSLRLLKSFHYEICRWTPEPVETEDVSTSSINQTQMEPVTYSFLLNELSEVRCCQLQLCVTLHKFPITNHKIITLPVIVWGHCFDTCCWCCIITCSLWLWNNTALFELSVCCYCCCY